jgi:hypothetical protein
LIAVGISASRIVCAMKKRPEKILASR